MKKTIFTILAICTFTIGLYGNTITVTNLNDSGAGSLRQAVINAASGDTIDFAVTGTITIISGRIDIGKSLSIIGPGMDVLSISGNGGNQLFQITGSSTSALISGLTLENTASANLFSGIRVISSADLVLADCRISEHNYSVVVQSSGTCEMIRCIICENNGSIWVEGATFAMDNCAYIGNADPSVNPGAISVFGGSIATIRNSTITGNDIGMFVNGSTTLLVLFNNIISDNVERDFWEIGGTVIANNNLIRNPNFHSIADGVNDNLVGEAYDPLFVSPTPSGCSADLQLQAGSPAINAGNNIYIPAGPDLAGNPRINDDIVDMGAYEFGATSEQCPDSLAINDVPIPAGNYQAATYISSVGQVSNSDSVCFTAGTEIVLLPGFETLPGAWFKANIDTCQSASITEPQVSLLNDDGLNEEEQEKTKNVLNTLEAYPNPFMDECNLQISLTEKTSAEIQVFSLNGERAIYFERIDNLEKGLNNLSLDTSDWPAGMYLLIVKTEIDHLVSRLVKI